MDINQVKGSERMIRLKELFRLENLKKLRLIAGQDGLERTVTAAVLLEYDSSRMELPDFYEELLVRTGYIAMLEEQIEAKKRLLAQTAESSAEHQQALADLEALQNQHQEYSEQLLQNKIDLEELEQAMEEQRNAIREMEIDLRDLIHDAIMDREE